MKNMLHKETTERWLSRWVSIELLACLYIGHEKRETKEFYYAFSLFIHMSWKEWN
jgi:hypothetical protein